MSERSQIFAASRQRYIQPVRIRDVSIGDEVPLGIHRDLNAAEILSARSHPDVVPPVAELRCVIRFSALANHGHCVIIRAPAEGDDSCAACLAGWQCWLWSRPA